MGGRRRCCCLRGCDIHHTTFPDDSELDKWTVIEGVWTHEEAVPPETGQWLQEAGNADALIVLDIEHPRRHETGFIDVDLIDFQVGMDLLIVCNYVDEDNFLYGRVIYEGGNEFTFAVGDCTEGVETDRETVTVATAGETFDNVYLCYGPKDDGGNILLALESMIEAPGTPRYAPYVRVFTKVLAKSGGYQVGLANRSEVTIKIAHFKWDEHYQTNKLGECWWCMCTCEEEIMGPHLTATILSSNTNIDGHQFTLDYNEELSSPAQGAEELYIWTSEEWYCDNLRLAPQLVCWGESCDREGHPKYACPKEKLAMESGCVEPCTSDPLQADGATGTCSPLYLTFGPYNVPDDYGECGCDAPCTFSILLTA